MDNKKEPVIKVTVNSPSKKALAAFQKKLIELQQKRVAHEYI